jgi:hypothetical protein
MDTYVPSGEESAQEQQFLQSLISAQSKESAGGAKYASQLFVNFCGDYQSLAVDNPMVTAGTGFSYSGYDNYVGLLLMQLNPEYNGDTASLLGGMPYRNYSNPSTGKPCWAPTPNFTPSSGDVIRASTFQYPSQFAYFRQSFLYSPFVIAMPRFLNTFKVGMRLYNNVGTLQQILIASKTGGAGQAPTINNSFASDGSYNISTVDASTLPLGTKFFLQQYNPFSITQWAFYRNTFNILSISERQSGGNSVVTLNISNNVFFVNSLNQPIRWAFNVWDNTGQQPSPNSSIQEQNSVPPSPQVGDPSLPNMTLTITRPIPSSFPTYRYFALNYRQLWIGGSYLPITGAYAIYYPADYPNTTPSLIQFPANYDCAEVTLANYSVVNPQPSGFQTPPLGVTQFNSLDLSTMPLIGCTITP